VPYKITWKARGVIWTFSGSLTGKDAIQANLDIYGDPRFDDLRYQIVDISEVEQFNIASEDLDAAASLDDAATISNNRLIVAIVAANMEAVKVAKLYEAAMETCAWKVKIFGSLQDAQEWIRLTCGSLGDAMKRRDA